MTLHPSSSEALARSARREIYLVTFRLSLVIESLFCLSCLSALDIPSHRRVPAACDSSGHFRLARFRPCVENGELRLSGLLSGRKALSPGLPSRADLRLDLDPAPEGPHRNSSPARSLYASNPFFSVAGATVLFPATAFGQAMLAASQPGFAWVGGLSPERDVAT